MSTTPVPLTPMIWGILGVVLFATLAIRPERAWEVLSSWAYEDPEANRPSRAAFTVQRVVASVMLLVSVGAIVLGVTAPGRERAAAERAAEREATCQEVAEELESILRFENGRVANPDKVRAWGQEHGYDVVANSAVVLVEGPGLVLTVSGRMGPSC